MAKYVCDNPPAPGKHGIILVYDCRGIRCARKIRNAKRHSRRVKTAPEFANTRKESNVMKTASPLASAVHRLLPENCTRAHFQRLNKMAMQLLREGKAVEDITPLLAKEGEAICKELTGQKIHALSGQRKNGVSVFSFPVTDKPFTGDRCSRFTTFRRRRFRLSSWYRPDLVPQ